jgi:hypothetical protein
MVLLKPSRIGWSEMAEARRLTVYVCPECDRDNMPSQERLEGAPVYHHGLCAHGKFGKPLEPVLLVPLRELVEKLGGNEAAKFALNVIHDLAAAQPNNPAHKWNQADGHVLADCLADWLEAQYGESAR